MVTTIFSLFVSLAWVTGTAVGMRTQMTKTDQKQSCGNWIPYGKEKCLHIVDSATFQTMHEADVVCQSLVEIMSLDDVPRVVTVRNEIEQQDLEKILFEEGILLEPVWLGLSRDDDGVFSWSNGAEMQFSNLANQNVSDADKPCVQMESGEGNYPMGKWVRVNCRKRNVVICEKILVWPVAKLQNAFLNLKSVFEKSEDRKKKAIGSQQEESNLFSGEIEPSSCGDWVPYKKEKCILIAYDSGLHTKSDAEGICRSFAKSGNKEDVPKLITVKTKEKQEFLEKYLFENQTMVDNVWLGLNMDDENGQFRWHDDEMEMYFTNWHTGTPEVKEHTCVQMASGQNVYPQGNWVRTNCQMSLRVVCEKQQPWSVPTLQNQLLNLELKQQEAQKQILALLQNPVPMNFIYVQLPGQEPPATIWPQVVWSEVSSQYSGLFFRVVGGNAASFGEVQDSSTSNLREVQRHHQYHDYDLSASVPSDGSWSRPVSSNRDDGRGIHWWGMSFRMSGNEIRPRNKAVKVWQRTG